MTIAGDMKPSVTVSPGYVRINCIDLSYISDSICVLDIDFHSKRAVPYAFGSASDGRSVEFYVGKDEHTLHMDESKTDVTVIVVTIPMEWEINDDVRLLAMVNIGRYSGAIVIRRIDMSSEHEQLWPLNP